MKIDRWVTKLYGLELPYEGDVEKFLDTRGVAHTDTDRTSLGTIGSGNHFAELQAVEEVIDEDAFHELNMDRESLYLLVHSGSRSYGAQVLSEYNEQFGNKGLLQDSVEAREYLQKHDHAVQWAKCNRQLITHRFLSTLQSRGTGEENETEHEEGEDQKKDGSYILDITHNCILKKEFLIENSDEKEELWLHRKGAAPSDVGPVVIPGSRGAFSYLVIPTPSSEIQQTSAYSLAHGAGRRWNRYKALQAGKASPAKASSFTTTELGSKVICEDKELLYEEAPSAYKEIELIIEDLKIFNLIKVVAVFRPLITYKVRAAAYASK